MADAEPRRGRHGRRDAPVRRRDGGGGGIGRAPRSRAGPRAHVRTRAARQPGGPDHGPRRPERPRDQGRVHRGRVGADDEGGHDLQRLEDLSLDYGGPALGRGVDRLGRGPRRAVHAGRRAVRRRAQRVHHLGSLAAADERLVGNAVGETGLGGSPGRRPPVRVSGPADARAGDVLQVQRRAGEPARAGGATRRARSTAGDAAEGGHGAHRGVEHVAVARLRELVGDDRRARRPVGERRRPLGRGHAHQRPRPRSLRLPLPADGELEGRAAHLRGVDRDGADSGRREPEATAT